MKKIAIVIADLDLGGGQRVAINLAQVLAKKNDVSLIIFQDNEIHYEAPGHLINIQCPSEKNIFKKLLMSLNALPG